MTSVVAVNSSQQQQSYGQPGVYRPVQQYYPAPANMAAQQSSNTNVVVTNQPARAPVQVSLPTEKPNPTTFIVTLILMSVCTFCFGMVPLLVCFIPALIFSVVGFNYGYSKSDGIRSQSRAFTYAAIGLDIAAMVVFAIAFVITVICVSVGAGQTASHFIG